MNERFAILVSEVHAFRIVDPDVEIAACFAGRFDGLVGDVDRSIDLCYRSLESFEGLEGKTHVGEDACLLAPSRGG